METGWYSGDQKPLPNRIGDYEMRYRDGTIDKSYWDGRDFLVRQSFTDDFDWKPHIKSANQSLSWRGCKNE